MTSLQRSFKTKWSPYIHAFTDSTSLYDVPFRTTSTLQHFTPVTVEVVDKLIANAPCKTSQLDPVLILLLKEMRAGFTICVVVDG